MKHLRVGHAADLHYCPKHLDYVDRAFGTTVDAAIAERLDLFVIAGDSFDSSMGIHEPAVTAYMAQVRRLADHMPVLVLSGTASHDRLGSLDLLRTLGGRYPVLVADRPMQVKLRTSRDFVEFTPRFEDECETACAETGADYSRHGNDSAFISVLPSLNKADPEVMAVGPAQYVRNLMAEFAPHNERARVEGVPTILVTHGTVTGSVTESAYAMVSPDHEFTADMLFASQAQAVMLGHIHKHQYWPDETGTRFIAYSGSITRLVHGHHDTCGWIDWTLSAHLAQFAHQATPSRELLEITFDGPPDLEALARIAAEQLTPDHHVRIRWSVDEEHAASVDKDAIRALFATAGSLKLEGSVNAIQSVRAKGIGRAETVDERLVRWIETTGDEARADALVDRLQALRAMEPGEIVSQFLESMSAARVVQAVENALAV